MERSQARDIFKRLAASFPSWKWDAETAKVWIDDLEQVDYEHAYANAIDYIRSGAKFAPALGEIIKDNPEVVAKREKERTRQMIDNELTRADYADPPWIKVGMDKDAWLKQEINKVKQAKS